MNFSRPWLQIFYFSPGSPSELDEQSSPSNIFRLTSSEPSVPVDYLNNWGAFLINGGNSEYFCWTKPDGRITLI